MLSQVVMNWGFGRRPYTGIRHLLGMEIAQKTCKRCGFR